MFIETPAASSPVEIVCQPRICPAPVHEEGAEIAPHGYLGGEPVERVLVLVQGSVCLHPRVVVAPIFLLLFPPLSIRRPQFGHGVEADQVLEAVVGRRLWNRARTYFV